MAGEHVGRKGELSMWTIPTDRKPCVPEPVRTYAGHVFSRKFGRVAPRIQGQPPGTRESIPPGARCTFPSSSRSVSAGATCRAATPMSLIN